MFGLRLGVYLKDSRPPAASGGGNGFANQTMHIGLTKSIFLQQTSVDLMKMPRAAA
jgi:hypothetical protein